ncbi:tyrosine-type recombinase/integrase [Niallia endozanthoxylica]|uniref:Tyrosine-type recombinase/integrase n=1 Tax=Niallia endozanthoxylica TaxID=2036016 RepID=A0A5J5H996_9BACI|nr:tyrosine-type recombinase/integrase [Niallia endozanthoxylica]
MSLSPSLRHSHTSILAKLKFDLIEIMERLGHPKEETTVNVYLHVTTGKKKRPPASSMNLLAVSVKQILNSQF